VVKPPQEPLYSVLKYHVIAFFFGHLQFANMIRKEAGDGQQSTVIQFLSEKATLSSLPGWNR